MKHLELKTLLVHAMLLTLVGCQELSNNNESPEAEKQPVEADNVSFEWSNWVDAVNNENAHLIEEFYRKESVKIISADSILSGPSEIAGYYARQPKNIKSISSLYRVEANKEKRINYEIIEYKTANGDWYTQLLIWRLENESQAIEFEFVSKMSKQARHDEQVIADRRSLWMELCNAHNPKNLVNTLYSTNNIYFNHRPLIIGSENLIEEYSYMQDENYELTLNPLKMIFVNDNLVYEIGQCDGNYNGKYILIWEKEPDGIWRVFIDSNV